MNYVKLLQTDTPFIHIGTGTYNLGMYVHTHFLPLLIYTRSTCPVKGLPGQVSVKPCRQRKISLFSNKGAAAPWINGLDISFLVWGVKGSNPDARQDFSSQFIVVKVYICLYQIHTCQYCPIF